MRSIKYALLLSVAVLLASEHPAAAQGKFKGELALTPLSGPDGRSRTAKVLWAAVYNFGPSWGPGAKKPALPATEAEQKQLMAALQAWVERADPIREEIAKAIDLGRVPQ
jgi:hypothetical protein